MTTPTLPTTVHTTTRRRFLTWSGVTAGALVAGGAATLSWPQLFAAAQRTPLDPQAGVLVVVTLYGGNDGLNTVVPAADPAYAAARPDLAYRPDEVLDVGTGLGLNPGLKGLKSLWDDKSLAIVHGVGYPKPDRSHFASMAIWQCGSPGTPATSGWLGRWLDLAPDPVKALALDPVLPPLLAGTRTAGSTLGRTRLALPRGAAGRTVAGLALPSPSDGPWQAAAATSLADLVKASGTFHDAVAEIDDQQDETTAPGGSAGGQSDLAKQLAIVAGLVELGVPTRVYSVSLGGFDTHSNERGTQERLLAQLDAALCGFAARLAKTERGRQVVTMVYSEFGRRVHANASEGTDHGTAGPMFVFGRGVQGGHYGSQPSLTDLDEGDLRASTDFRDVYGSMLTGVLGADPGQVLNGWTNTVPRLFG